MALIECKECGSTVSANAVACPKCGAPTVAGRLTAFLEAMGKVGFGSFVVICFLGIFLWGKIFPDKPSTSALSQSAANSSTDARPAVAPPAPSGPLLEVQSHRCEVEYSYVFVRGEVKNITTESLKNVAVVGEFRTKSGELVKSETALLEYNPILPGQTSPFRAGGTSNPQIAKCGIAFKYLMGGTIDFTEKAKKRSK